MKATLGTNLMISSCCYLRIQMSLGTFQRQHRTLSGGLLVMCHPFPLPSLKALVSRPAPSAQPSPFQNGRTQAHTFSCVWDFPMRPLMFAQSSYLYFPAISIREWGNIWPTSGTLWKVEFLGLKSIPLVV